MKISTKGRYALRMMIDLAEHQGDGFIALKDIAQRQNISKKYLEQIVPILNRSSFLRTNRGYQGGYRLAREPRAYTVREILALTEGGLAPDRLFRRRYHTLYAQRILRDTPDVERSAGGNRGLSGKDYAAGPARTAAGALHKLAHYVI